MGTGKGRRSPPGTVRVFVSSVTSEFLSCREEIHGVLLQHGIFPVTQEHFPPDYRTVIEVLEDAIRPCHAVIAIVGFRFGSAPFAPLGTRRSYTQLELDISRRLGKPVFLFVARRDLSPQSPIREAVDDIRLQSEFRNALLSEDHRYEYFSDADQLTSRVRDAIPVILELDTEAPLPLSGIGLPKAPTLFVGRAVETEQLNRALVQPTPSLIAVLGVAGQGKSTLVAHWIREHAENKFRASFWCTVSPSVSFGLLLEEALTYFLRGDYHPRESDAAAKIRRLVNLLQTGSLLLVIDGLEQWMAGKGDGRAENEVVITDFLLQTTGLTGGAHVIVTSRVLPSALDDASVSIVPVYPEDRRMQLEGLDEEAAVDLLEGLGAKGSRDELIRAANSYSRHPLALTILARSAAKRSGGLLTAEASSAADEPKERVFRLFSEALGQAGISLEAERTLHVTALALEGLHIDALRHGVAAATRLSGYWKTWLRELLPFSRASKPPDLVDAILHLSDWHLIEWNPVQQTVVMHSLVREYVAGRCQKPRVIHGALSDWYGRKILTDDITTLQQAQPRIIALEHAIRAGDCRRGLELFFGPLTRRHTLAEWLLAFGHHSRELPEQLAQMADGADRGDCLVVRGTMSRRIGALEDAEKDLDSAIEIFRRLPKARPALAAALMNRGNVFRQMCSYAKALQDYSSSLDFLRSIPNSANEVALLLLNRASLLHDLGYCSRALRDADVAVGVFEEAEGRAAADDLPSALVVRGSIRAHMEQMVDADADYKRAAALWERRIAAGEVEWESFLARQRVIRSLCLSQTHGTAMALVELDRAIRFLEDQVRDGHDESEALAIAFLNLTEVRRCAGQLAEGLNSARRSVDLFRMLFSSGRTELEGYLAHALMQTARLAAEAADWDTCRTSLDEGLAISSRVLGRGQLDLMIPFLVQVGALVWLFRPKDLDRSTALTVELLDRAAAGLKTLRGSELICRHVRTFLTRLGQSGDSALLSPNASPVAAWLRQHAVVQSGRHAETSLD